MAERSWCLGALGLARERGHALTKLVRRSAPAQQCGTLGPFGSAQPECIGPSARGSAALSPLERIVAGRRAQAAHTQLSGLGCPVAQWRRVSTRQLCASRSALCGLRARVRFRVRLRVVPFSTTKVDPQSSIPDSPPLHQLASLASLSRCASACPEPSSQGGPHVNPSATKAALALAQHGAFFLVRVGLHGINHPRRRDQHPVPGQLHGRQRRR